MELKTSALHWLVAGGKARAVSMTHGSPRNRGIVTASYVGIVVGGLLIVGAVYLGQNPNNKRTSPPISSSAHTGTGSETTGSGNFR